MLKHSKDPLHFSLYIIPGHFKKVFFATFFISIQDPAMNNIINIKINSSSQWYWLSSEVSMRGAVTPGDDKKKLSVIFTLMCFLSFLTVIATDCNYFFYLFSVGF